MRVVIPMQMRCPFPPSTRRHRLVAVDAGRTEVVDKVEAWLEPRILSGAVGLPLLLGCRARFYRATSTLRIARNGWLSRLERTALVVQAMAILI